MVFHGFRTASSRASGSRKEASGPLLEPMHQLLEILTCRNRQLMEELNRRHELIWRLFRGQTVGRVSAGGPHGVLRLEPGALTVRYGTVTAFQTPANNLPGLVEVTGGRPGPEEETQAPEEFMLSPLHYSRFAMPLKPALARFETRAARELIAMAADVTAFHLEGNGSSRDREQQPEMVDRSQSAVLVLDSDLTVRLMNRTWMEMVGGGTVSDHLAMPVFKWLPIRDEWRLIRRSLESGQSPLRPLALSFRREDGSLLTLPVRIHPVHSSHNSGHVVLVMDFNHHQSGQDDRTMRERQARRFFEEDLTGDYTCTPDGRIVSCNAAFAHIFGFESPELAMQSNLRQLHPSGQAADQFLHLLKKYRKLVYHESEMRRIDGKPIYVIRNVNGQFDADGHLIGITGTIFDNTQNKILEDRIRQSQKMESVGRLAGGIAHDFNNLLLAIQGYASLLHDHVSEDAEGLEAVTEIQKAADRAASLTRQLLAFSRRQVLQPTQLNLNTVISDLSQLLQRMLGEDVELVAQLAPDLGMIRADRGQLEQVLVNLASNSRDAMPRGGRLSLATSNVHLQDTWFDFHDGPPPGPYVQLTVTDNGIGMTEEVKAHLFEPFFTTKEQGKGTGLGLPSVYGIVKQSGGEVQVYSEPGQGTTFKIFLPSQGHPGVKENIGVAESDSSSRIIMVVEDEPAVRSLIAKVLRKEGHDVIEANSGTEALTLSQQHDGKIDLLITDLVMPGMDGRELSEHLSSDRGSIPILFMSGYTEDAVVRHGVMMETTNFLQKPFTPSVFMEKVREILSQAGE